MSSLGWSVSGNEKSVWLRKHWLQKAYWPAQLCKAALQNVWSFGTVLQRIWLAENLVWCLLNVSFLFLSFAVFICSFMVAAPIFGYLGDRFNRKIILSCGIFFWSAVTFSSSFITEQVRSLQRHFAGCPGKMDNIFLNDSPWQCAQGEHIPLCAFNI